MLFDSQIDDDDESDDDANPSPIFSGLYKHRFHLHTYAPIAHLLYHLGPNAFKPTQNAHQALSLTNTNASRWAAFNKPAVKQKLIIKIPARRLASFKE